MMMSEQKSGPSKSAIDRMRFGFFGLPPDNDSCVNSSLGSSMTKSGPNTTLDFLEL